MAWCDVRTGACLGNLALACYTLMSCRSTISKLPFGVFLCLRLPLLTSCVRKIIKNLLQLHSLCFCCPPDGNFAIITAVRDLAIDEGEKERQGSQIKLAKQCGCWAFYGMFAVIGTVSNVYYC